MTALYEHIDNLRDNSQKTHSFADAPFKNPEDVSDADKNRLYDLALDFVTKRHTGSTGLDLGFAGWLDINDPRIITALHTFLTPAQELEIVKHAIQRDVDGGWIIQLTRDQGLDYLECLLASNAKMSSKDPKKTVNSLFCQAIDSYTQKDMPTLSIVYLEEQLKKLDTDAAEKQIIKMTDAAINCIKTQRQGSDKDGYFFRWNQMQALQEGFPEVFFKVVKKIQENDIELSEAALNVIQKQQTGGLPPTFAQKVKRQQIIWER